MNKFEAHLREAWQKVLEEYRSGKVVLVSEGALRDRLYHVLVDKLAVETTEPHLFIALEEKNTGKRIDIRLGELNSPLLLQLKLYHDPADWKETPTMKGTVESDLRFIQGHPNRFLGIIDVIPSTTRPLIPFQIRWKSLKIEDTLYRLYYKHVNPKSAYQREQDQSVALIKGSDLV